MLTAVTLALLMNLPMPAPEPAGFKIDLDVNRGVDVVLYVEGVKIQPGKLYKINGLGGPVTVKGRAVFYNDDERKIFEFPVELQPGYISELTVKIRANPPPVVLVRR